MCIPKSTTTTLTDDIFLSRLREVTDNISVFYISDKSPDRNFEDEILCSCTVHLLGSSLLSVFCLDDLLMAELTESCLMSRRAEDDISAITTVTTIRTTLRDVLLTTPRYDAIPSFTCTER
jgi:hypothetical protein